MAGVLSKQLNDARYRRGETYRCHAYVCGVTCVKRTDRDPPPSASFAQIYQQRPDDCRYAVVGQWDITRASDRFIVWDLFNVLKNNETGAVIIPRPRFQHDDLDAAIMATVLLYNKEVSCPRSST